MAHVTIDALDARVRRCVKGDELRFHHRVTGLAAELDGLGVLVSAIAAESTGTHEDKRAGWQRECQETVARFVVVDLWIRRNLWSGRASSATSREQHAGDDHQ